MSTSEQGIRFIYIPLALLGIAILHFFALFAGVYDAQIASGFVWFDNFLHICVGAVFGLVWMWILQHRNITLSLFSFVLSIIGVAFVFATLWELLEFVFLLMTPMYAHIFQIYSPSMVEAAFDIASDVLGGVAVAVVVYLRARATT